MLLDIESSKYSDLGTVFDINTRTGLASFYGLTKLKYDYGLIFEWKNPSYIQLLNKIESSYQLNYSAEPNCPFTLR